MGWLILVMDAGRVRHYGTGTNKSFNGFETQDRAVEHANAMNKEAPFDCRYFVVHESELPLFGLA